MANGTIGPSQNIYSAPQPPPSYVETPVPKPKSNTIKIILGITVGILFFSTVGASIALYTRAWDPLWNPFRPEPNKVIQEMSQRMEKVKTIHSETKINTEVKNEDGSADILMSFNSDADTADNKNQKTAGDFNLTFSMKSTSSYGPDEIKFSLGGEAKTLGSISYFELNPFPTMIVDSLRSETGIDLNEVLANKWIKIDPDSIMKSFEELLKTYLGEEVPPEMIDELFGKQAESQKNFKINLRKY